MAEKYWVGGSGNISDNTNHWSDSDGGAPGAVLPGSGDNVNFTVNSSTIAYTVTVNVYFPCGSMIWANPLEGSPTLAGSSTLDIFGSLSLVAGMVRTWTGLLRFYSTIGGQTITCNGVTFASTSIYFKGVGGGWTLVDALTNTGEIGITDGSFNSGNQTINCTSFVQSSANIRSVTLGSSTITCSAQWISTDTTNLTFDAGTSSISTVGSFSGGGLTYYNVSISSSFLAALTGTNTFNNLTLTSADSISDRYITFDSNQIISNLLTTTGFSIATRRLALGSSVKGAARTLTAASVALTNTDFEDITAAGAAAPFTGTSLGNCGGNTNITTTTPVTRYWVGGAGNWSATGEWSASSGGASGASVPLVHDTVVFDAASFSADNQTVTIDVWRFPSISFAGIDQSVKLTISPSGCISYGSVDLTNINTLTATSAFIFSGRGAYAIKSNGKQWGQNLTFNSYNGTYTLLDNLSSDGASASDTFCILSGTFDANDFNVTYARIDLDDGITRVCTMGNGTWTATGTGTVWDADPSTNLTLNAEGSTIVISNTTATAKTVAGGGLTYNNITVSGDNVILSGSNTINILAVNTAGLATGLKIASASTQTVSGFTTNGSVGNLAIIQSSSAGSAHNLSKATGTISVDYMSIKDSAAAGGADWYAGANSTDVSGNSGWIFTGPPSGDSSMQQYQYYYS